MIGGLLTATPLADVDLEEVIQKMGRKGEVKAREQPRV